MLSKDEMRKIFLSCDMLNKDGLYADDVDVYELCAAVEKAVAMKYARAERAECIKFVRSLNTEVAWALSEKRGGDVKKKPPSLGAKVVGPEEN